MSSNPDLQAYLNLLSKKTQRVQDDDALSAQSPNSSEILLSEEDEIKVPISNVFIQSTTKKSPKSDKLSELQAKYRNKAFLVQHSESLSSDLLTKSKEYEEPILHKKLVESCQIIDEVISNQSDVNLITELSESLSVEESIHLDIREEIPSSSDIDHPIIRQASALELWEPSNNPTSPGPEKVKQINGSKSHVSCDNKISDNAISKHSARYKYNTISNHTSGNKEVLPDKTTLKDSTIKRRKKKKHPKYFVTANSSSTSSSEMDTYVKDLAMLGQLLLKHMPRLLPGLLQQFAHSIPPQNRAPLCSTVTSTSVRLDECLHQNVNMTRQFLESHREIYNSYMQSLQSSYKYTDLRRTEELIAGKYKKSKKKI